MRRVRKAVPVDEIKYYYTEKFRLSDAIRIERENEISEDEYKELFMKKAEYASPIIKTRYFLKKDDLCFEIDIYPEWETKAMIEVEIPTETTVVVLPKWMKVIREVTGDERYKNHSLAFNGFEGL